MLETLIIIFIIYWFVKNYKIKIVKKHNKKDEG